MTTQQPQNVSSEKSEAPRERTEGALQPQIFEIAILGRVTWDLHSLNNEGSIGNVTEPRTIVLWDGTRTDGVSGEMMKHIHAYWTWLQATQDQRPSLCNACRTFQPQRADAARQELNVNDNTQAVATAISRCVLCDLHGFLVQQPTVHRQSVVEFGWVVGVPGNVHRDVHVHARHAIAERGVEREEEERVAAQMVYHRPTRSGVYAFVTLFQPWRIGLNEVNYTYALNDDHERNRRYGLGMTAYEWTFKRPDGAMTSTRFPHIERIEGIVLISRQVVPVPMLSPLQEDYRKRLEAIARQQGVEVRMFDDMNGLVDILTSLKRETPMKMCFQEAPPASPSAGSSASPARRRGRRSRGERAQGELEQSPREAPPEVDSEADSEME